MSILKLKGSSSGEAEVTVAAAAGTTTITLPTASINLATAGTDGQFLKTNGSGTLSFTDAPGGLFSNYALVVDKKTQATDGGDFVKDVREKGFIEATGKTEEVKRLGEISKDFLSEAERKSQLTLEEQMQILQQGRQ